MPGERRLLRCSYEVGVRTVPLVTQTVRHAPRHRKEHHGHPSHGPGRGPLGLLPRGRRPHSPKLLLLGGFPASSHQFRNLIPALADRFHVLSPDYPGLRQHRDARRLRVHIRPALRDRRGPARPTGFHPFGLYHQDYGGPIGNRIIGRHPDWLEWQVIQNSNAYEEGFTAAWDGIRHALWVDRAPRRGAARAVPPSSTASSRVHPRAPRPRADQPRQLEHGPPLPRTPRGAQVQLDLLYDYRTNVELYPQWQAFLRERQPKTLILWGEKDIFFTPEGGRAYLRDLPRPSCTCSTAGISRSRTRSRRSRRASSASTTPKSTAPPRRRRTPSIEGTR